MDRFESQCRFQVPFSAPQIYIPIWIDLKGIGQVQTVIRQLNLHSNMDRFERRKNDFFKYILLKFTFQYG